MRTFILNQSNAIIIMINFVKSFFTDIAKFPNFIKNNFSQLWDYFYNLRYKLKHMKESNMELGLYHLRNRNWNDAIFRFSLVDRFLEPGNKLANYWLGWAYLLKKDHKKSIIHLEKAGSEDKIGMLAFVKAIDFTQYVPTEIYALNRDIMADIFIDKFASEIENIPQNLVVELNEAITESLPEEYTILELGSNIGLLGNELNKRMQESCKITGVEISAEMIKNQSAYFPERNIYDRVIQAPIDEFLEKSVDKYDVICSLDGFTFFSNLENIFKTTFSKLHPGGYFAFAVHSAPKNSFSSKTLEFVYSSKQLRGQLIESGFNILVAKEFTIEIKNNYSIFVCSK